MLFAVAFRLPEIIEKHLRGFHMLVLARLDLRLRPVNAVNLRLTVSKRAEIVIFRRVLELFDKIVALQVIANLLIPGARLVFREDAFNHAAAALADAGFLRVADAAINDVVGMDLRYRAFAARGFAFDGVNLARDIGFQFGKHGLIVRQRRT